MAPGRPKSNCFRSRCVFDGRGGGDGDEDDDVNDEIKKMRMSPSQRKW